MVVQTEPELRAHPAAAPTGDVLVQSWSVFAAGHDMRLFAESAPLIQSMAEDIRAATKRVWLEVYIFMDDDAGREIAEALKDRARAGLDVRVMYDAIGSVSTAAAFFRDLEQAGVKLHAFHSLWEAFRGWRALRIL